MKSGHLPRIIHLESTGYGRDRSMLAWAVSAGFRKGQKDGHVHVAEGRGPSGRGRAEELGAGSGGESGATETGNRQRTCEELVVVGIFRHCLRKAHRFNQPPMNSKKLEERIQVHPVELLSKSLPHPSILVQDLKREYELHGSAAPGFQNLSRPPAEEHAGHHYVRVKDDPQESLRTSRTAASTSSTVMPARRAASSAEDTS